MKLGFASAILSIFLAGCSPAANSPAPSAVVTPAVYLAAATPDSLVLVWRFEIQDQWYLYAPYRNDTGLAPEIALALPAGWTAGALHFPVPARKVLPGGILDHVYHDELLVTQTLWTSGMPAPAGGLQARLAWLACRDICVPGQDTLTVPVGGAPDPLAAALNDRARRQQPPPLPPGVVQCERDAAAIRLTVPGASRLVVIPAADGPQLADLLYDGAAEGETLTLRLRGGPDNDKPLAGVLTIDYLDGRRTAGTLVM